jgi:invasion protein IalB
MMFEPQHLTLRSLIRAAGLIAALGFGLAAASGAWGQAAKPAAPAAPAPAAAAPAAGAAAPAAGTPAQPGQAPASEVQQEPFGDWRVVCLTQPTGKRCTLIQEQAAPQTRQRMLAVEVALNGDKLEGLLLLPFGLLLERGVVLQLDEQPAQPALRFRTCLPAGCVVPINFDAKTLAALRNGKNLKLKVALDGGQEPNLVISLNGFGQAVDRLVALRKG